MIEIPNQLQNRDFRFILLRPHGKEPLELGWQTKNNYSFDNEKLKIHLTNNCNYGIVGGYGSLVLVDSDHPDITKLCEEKLPKTFTIRSSKEWKRHYYFVSGTPIKPIRLSQVKLGDMGDIRTIGQYVVAPNSIHPSGLKYEIIRDLPIQYITELELRNVFFDVIERSIKNRKGGDSTGKEYEPKLTLRSSPYIKYCKVPDYCSKNKLKGNTSKNFELFPYLVDLLHNRQANPLVYEKIVKTQEHSIGAINGWVELARQGKLMKGTCEKMKDYIRYYHPELEEDICGGCVLHTRLKAKAEKDRINKINYGIEVISNGE